MNILYITDKAIIGGATVAFLNLVTELKDYEDVNVTVITVDNNELNRKLDELNIPNIADHHLEAMQEIYSGRLPYVYHKLKAMVKVRFNRIYSIKRIESTLNMNEFDIIHTNSARTDIGGFLSRKYAIPHLMHVREFGTLDYGCTFLHPGYINFLNRNVDKFISVSNAVRDYWISLGVDEKKISTIYDGVNAERFEKKKFVDGDKLKLICCGSIRKSKGQDQIVDAIALLPEEIRKNVSLDLYGWPDQAFLNELFQKVKEYGLTEQIKYGGVSKDIPRLLLQYDIGLTPSKAEGFGLVTNEYMLAGLGVIVSDTGSNKELINNSIGRHFEFGNIYDLAEKIKELYFNREKLVQLGSCAREYALNNFTSKINAKNMYREYVMLLEEGK